MTSALSPVTFDAPLLNPAPNGLFAATQWTDETGPLRWMPSGVDFHVFNYGGGSQFGVWTAAWNAKESDLGANDVKEGVRPEFPDTFLALTTYAADECDLLKTSRDEIDTRAQQVHRLQEPNQVEATLAARMLADATLGTAADIVAAVGKLEAAFAKTNTVGLIHASAGLATLAAKEGLITRSGSVLKSPLGHTWVFGGGYVDTLGTKLIATSPTYGWRGSVTQRVAPSMEVNEYVAIVERSLVVGYEALVGAVNIT